MTHSLIRFITAGSVDDGKSTLIGRLLYDSKTLLNDQLQSLDADNPDFAALTDGLSAEREQGITIDVAYRYFATPRRKFIIADTPGHEQYTRNMVTGASTADAAVILIDATRVDFSGEEITLLRQTKRHSALVNLLGIRHIIIAVNKLDLLDFDEDKYRAIVEAYARIAQTLGIAHFTAIPISARAGDNVVEKSTRTPWYTGETLLATLENLGSDARRLDDLPAVFPVQHVLRQDGSTKDDFRGYQGRLEQGTLHVGDTVQDSIQGQTAIVSGIIGLDGEQKKAAVGDNITVVLDKDIDISRGDMLTHQNAVASGRNLYVAVCWFDEQPLNPARRYLLKQGVSTVAAKIRGIDYLLDPDSLQHSRSEDSQTLKMNDIARLRLVVQRPLVSMPYQDNPRLGAFILLDESSNQTVAAGMIRAADNPAVGGWSI